MQDHRDNVKITKEYYDGIAHEIYKECWGGENHHLGLFDSTDDFFEAGQRSNENLLSKIETKGDEKILDLGSGFCGLPRILARSTGCHITGLNLSTKENEYAVQKNKEEGLDHLIEVVEGDFNNMPFEDESFDILVSQESMLHSPDKKLLLKECYRILKKGGQFVFSDILESPSITSEEANIVYSRINVPYLATFDFYKEQLNQTGFEIKEVQSLGSENLGKSYQAVHDQLKAKKDRLMKEKNIPEENIDQTLKALLFWVEKAFENKLEWGLFVTRKK